MSKLKDADVREIRDLYSSGVYRQQDLADKFGVDQVTVSCIIRRKTWKHVV